MGILIAVLVVMILFFVVLGVIFGMTFARPNKRQSNFYNIPLGKDYEKERKKMFDLVDNMLTFDFEQVSVKSFDGLTLKGRYYHFKDGAPLIIAFHGYRGTLVRDMCGSFEIARRGEFNFLTVSQRAHGESQGRAISFGVNEKYDCKTWSEYAQKRFGLDTQIILCGVSMGATTVLMASELDLPKSVKMIIADCPFSSPELIIKKVIKEDKKLSPTLFYPIVNFTAKLFGGFSLKGKSAQSAVTKSKVPIMIIHGDDDLIVPIEMSENIKKANKTIRFEKFVGAGHGLCYMKDEPRYINIVNEFIAENIK